MKPFRIFIGGEELERYTSAKLQRSKKQLTGSLEVNVFFESVPTSPQIVQAMRGKEILVYVMNQLAFTGLIDKRTGKTEQPRDSKGRFVKGPKTIGGGEGDGISASISQQGYTVTITARGKTKYLIDSSHGQTVTTFKKTTDRKLIEQLLSKFQVELDWQGEENDIRLARVRDGSTVATELFNFCNEHCHFIYETRDGKLRIIDEAEQTTGENIVLGQNILTFNAQQSEDQANSDIVVKGHRNDPEVWGNDAVTVPVENIKDSWVASNIPLDIQVYGDATGDKLKKRAKYEADRRSEESKSITVTVFHIASRGVPWDIGILHYVEIPCEGVFDVLECTDLTYTVDASGTLETELTLSPPPSGAISGAGNSLTKGVSNAVSDLAKMGIARRVAAGVTLVPGLYPSSWTSAALSIIANPIIGVVSMVNGLLKSPSEQNRKPPMSLPDD